MVVGSARIIGVASRADDERVKSGCAIDRPESNPLLLSNVSPLSIVPVVEKYTLPWIVPVLVRVSLMLIWIGPKIVPAFVRVSFPGVLEPVLNTMPPWIVPSLVTELPEVETDMEPKLMPLEIVPALVTELKDNSISNCPFQLPKF